ncbi:PAS domain-containing protein [Mucilaginibacter robiniae]|uniref:histidine kinase n=1 Tax=Mucilaginibacter robiniae TaxID=2728022 RepID=A0A7L5E483_9SPHI|nr:HAMP domain-containing sensor histidine kinase [Mucilaginibacter robiniae]QJD97197.1 PAS domain-containing protein [Mucilaginibacter robiniae]
MDNGKSIFDFIDGKQLLRTTSLDGSMSGIIITNYQHPDNPIIYCNKAFEELTGYSYEEVIGKNCRFLQRDDRAQSSCYKLRAALEKGEECHVELVNYRKDGSLFWNELYIAPVQDGEGRITHYIGIQNDISERKLKGLSLKFKKLQDSELEQLKQDFITTASHELKTPLTSLKASLQLLNRLMDNDLTDTKQQLLLNKANTNLNKLASLIEDLLSVSRQESARLLHVYSFFNLNELIEKTIIEFELSARMSINIDGDKHVQVMADQDRIQQVLVNLLNNAIKYAPGSKGVLINLRDQGKEVQVSVQDSGSGIPPQNLPLIFNRYHRGEHHDLQVSGLGLGLFVAKEIVESHGGVMGVDSEVGKGSTFWFTLPVEVTLDNR